MKSFNNFWTFYLSAHSSRGCRTLHYAGSALALISLALFIFSARGAFLVSALFFGYGPAWLGHLLFEKNRPATFRYPIYSFLADWKMCWLALTGKLSKEFENLN